MTQPQDHAETDVEIYVGGSGETTWYGRDPNTLTVTQGGNANEVHASQDGNTSNGTVTIMWPATSRVREGLSPIRVKYISAARPKAMPGSTRVIAYGWRSGAGHGSHLPSSKRIGAKQVSS